MDPITFAVLEDDPALGIRVGDRVQIHVDRREIRLADGSFRPANYGRLLLAAELGKIAWLTPAKMLTFPAPTVPPSHQLRLIA